MDTILVWSQQGYGRSETRHVVSGLDDMRDLIATQLSGRLLYLEARAVDGGDEVLDSRLRIAVDDLTGEDYSWLTAPVRNEVRGVRA